MKIDSIKIAGFKSFADIVEFPVSNGITGIVGPNGCGKSNLIEALRWAMGETSAKRMRADGMDDVIFGGTDIRPPRASCEVTITLDNEMRSAPIEFNSEDRLDVSRKLSRGDGSTYKVNGRVTRARDVQILFKDAGVGAGSSALVSQGKVGSIINAKPSERRTILEEAAGVAGLTTRRHEAELRLKATLQNLERAEDMEKGLSEQLNSLRRQARQARRRREIDGLIISAEAMSFLVRWTHLTDKLSEGLKSFQSIEEAVKQAIISKNEAEKNLLELEAEAEPALKCRLDAEIELARATARVESLKKEAQSARSALATAKRSVTRIEMDIARERQNIGDSDDEFEDLKDRKAIAEDDQEYDAVLIEEAAELVEDARQELDSVSVLLQQKEQAIAVAQAEISACEKRLNDAIKRKEASESRLLNVQNALAGIHLRLSQIPQDDGQIDALEIRVSCLDKQVNQLASDIANEQDSETVVRSQYGSIASELSAKKSELLALKSIEDEQDVVAALISVTSGYEKAVAVALGEGASAGIGSGKQKWWEVSKNRVASFSGIKTLSDYVIGPEELVAFFSSVGVVDDEGLDPALAKDLKVGQILVTKSGQLWRWDGYRSLGVSGADEQIKRLARLKSLECEVSRLETDEVKQKSALDHQINVVAEVRSELERTRIAHKEALSELTDFKDKAADLIRERIELNSQASVLELQVSEFGEAAEADAIFVDECMVAHHEALKGKLNERDVDQVRVRQKEIQRAYEGARDQLDKRRRDAEARVFLIQNINQQMSDFDKRLLASKDLLRELEERLEEAVAEIEVLEAVEALGPDAEAAALDELDETIRLHFEAVESSRRMDAALDEGRAILREVEASLARVKEDRARIQAEHKASHEAAQELAREVGDRLSCEPSALLELSGMGDSDSLPDLASCDARVQRLIRERDALGTVNLLAEQQVVDVEGQLGDAGKVRDELREAVRRLRATITEFDREARERLTEAFNLIDGHFRELFSRLFVGGYAHLNLSGSDDILEAGLEIYACPPGKKLQTMSLLSGGEQAMAALALIFAVFLIRPAPVCVLDEVDAALDEANIDRLVSLVEDMARNNTTRFLVITHREMTMSRCDRLYGVTMMERGVSNLTSLDMASAIRLIEERV